MSSTKESSLQREAESFWSCAVVVTISQNKLTISKGKTNFLIRGTGSWMEKQTVHCIAMWNFEESMNYFRVKCIKFASKGKTPVCLKMDQTSIFVKSITKPFRMSKLAETVTNGGKQSMLLKCVPLLFSKCWHFLFQKILYFHSGLLEAVYKVVQKKGAY